MAAGGRMKKRFVPLTTAYMLSCYSDSMQKFNPHNGVVLLRSRS
jgi:hypothetical protein